VERASLPDLRFPGSFPISLHPPKREQVVNRWVLRALVVLVLMTVTASLVEAQRHRRAIVTQTGPRYGAHVGYNFDVDNALIGAQLSWPIVPSVDFYPSFEYYFVNPGSLWSLNFDLKYRPPTTYRAWYVGGGLNWSHASAAGVSNSDTGLNLLTGLEGRRGRTRPYVEAKFLLDNGSSFQVVGGISWR
jgi:hypothetical protein